MKSILRNQLLSRAILELYFTAKTPIHVGYGQEGTLSIIARFPVNGKLTPIIPSESLKGTLRYLAGTISKSMNFDQDTKKVVELHRKDTHMPEDSESKSSLIKDYKEKSRAFLENEGILSKKQLEELSDKDVVDLYFSLNCPICSLFGSKSLSGKINMLDMIPIHATNVTTYTSASILRKTLTVKEGSLYTIEAISPNTIFRTKIIVDNVLSKSDEANVLANLLVFIKERGLAVGGLKSRGYGLLELDANQSNVKVQLFNSNPKNFEDIVSNVSTLLLKEKYYKHLTIDEYVKMLTK
ncbi:MAG: RAMP superfamily CRISPR-associated protein [Brevinematia bacterium]